MLTKNVSLKDKTVLVTGAAGFIGTNLVKELLNDDETSHIVGLDNMNDYYDVSIKKYRLSEIEKLSLNKSCKWTFIKGNLADTSALERDFGFKLSTGLRTGLRKFA